MQPPRSPREDPNVRDALLERPASDIALILCPRCLSYGYYNEGSHFSCSNEPCEFWAAGLRLMELLGEGAMMSLADYADQEAEQVP